MKKRNLNFSPFETYRGSGLIFVRPHGARVYRLFEISEAYRTTEIMDLLLEYGSARGNVIVFRKDGHFMAGLCLELASMGVACAALESDNSYLN